MPVPNDPQTSPADTPDRLRIGVDVGGTFTDLVAFDGRGLSVVKVPSTPPDYERAVIEAVRRATDGGRVAAGVTHGSTVATNALLQRRGEPVAFVTTEGFRDLLLIARQNRPDLYALHPVRPEPVTPEGNWFTIAERIAADGTVVTPLSDDAVSELVGKIRQRGLRHAAVCLLFSFLNPAHEQNLARALRAAGITTTLSSEILPEFREYERACTTAINAALRPTVESYLDRLAAGLPAGVTDLRILQSAGGTASPTAAAGRAAKLVLSGPAGGVLGAAYIAKVEDTPNVITYDMGGTSTDVAAVRDATPAWTTQAVVDGLPLALPMFDIHTVGAGGGSVAYLDPGGSLRVGPRSAGAVPGPACYGRGGTEPTVTDANLVLGRLLPDQFLGGKMAIAPALARAAVERLARQIDRDVMTTALGIVRIAEANMAAAVRAVTSRRGHDPRHFALLSFGGAGGLHACAIAEALDVPKVLVPPYCGALSALGMVVAPPTVDVSRTVVHLDPLDDEVLAREFAAAEAQAVAQLPDAGAMVTRYADVRFRGQSYELQVSVPRLSLSEIRETFLSRYAALYGRTPAGRAVQLVVLRVRRTGRIPQVMLPDISQGPALRRPITLTDHTGRSCDAVALSRTDVVIAGPTAGPALLIDAESTAYLPAAWSARATPRGTLLLTRAAAG